MKGRVELEGRRGAEGLEWQVRGTERTLSVNGRQGRAVRLLSTSQCDVLVEIFFSWTFLALKKRPKVRSRFGFPLCTCTDCDGIATNEGL